MWGKGGYNISKMIFLVHTWQKKTEIRGRNIYALFPLIQPWMKMKSSAFMASTGISRFSSRYAKATWISVGNAIPYPTMQWQLTLQLFSRSIWCFLWKAGNPMIIVSWENSFYILPMKCLISHGYRHFKCYFKCSEPYLMTIQSCLTIKSTNWLIRLWIHCLLC